jgi:hypothetical protein
MRAMAAADGEEERYDGDRRQGTPDLFRDPQPALVL